MQICKVTSAAVGSNGQAWGLATPDGISLHATSYLRWLLLESGYAEGTKFTYAEAVKLFASFLESHSILSNLPNTDHRLIHANRKVIEDWLRSQIDDGIQRSTRHVRESAIKSFYNFLSTEKAGNVIVEHPYSRVAGLITRQCKSRRKFAVSEPVITKILLALHNEAERTFWQFIYDVGSRIGEMPHITRQAIDAAYCLYENARGKNRIIRYIPILLPTFKKGGSQKTNLLALVSVPALSRVIRYHQSDEYQSAPGYKLGSPDKPAFLTANGRPWTYQNSRKQLAAAVTRARLELPRSITPHIFRHSSASSILSSSDHGKDYMSRFLAMSMQLRHSTPHASELYAHLPLESLNQSDANDSVYQRAERIFKATYLSPRKHVERRGHRG